MCEACASFVGHASRSVTRVGEYIGERAEHANVASAAEHYRLPLGRDINDEIAEGGRVADRELGDDPASLIREQAERVMPMPDSVQDDTVISYPNDGKRLDHYLQTRVLELTVHTLDLLTALGLPVDLAVDSGHGGALALAATGRGLLPDRFSVLD